MGPLGITSAWRVQPIPPLLLTRGAWLRGFLPLPHGIPLLQRALLLSIFGMARGLGVKGTVLAGCVLLQWMLQVLLLLVRVQCATLGTADVVHSLPRASRAGDCLQVREHGRRLVQQGRRGFELSSLVLQSLGCLPQRVLVLRRKLTRLRLSGFSSFHEHLLDSGLVLVCWLDRASL